MDLNQVTLLGRSTKDTELKATESGKSVATNSIATGEKYKDSAGEIQEKTQFTNLVFWGKVAEIAAQYLTKWKRVLIQGKLQTRVWENAEGKKVYTTEVIVKDMILLDSKKEGEGGTTTTKPTTNKKPDSGGEEEISIEDVPF